MVLVLDSFKITDPKAAENLTTSSGDNVSPGLPPIVPLIPDIDFINDTYLFLDSYFKIQPQN
jgi:hypothetical protein